MTGAAQLIVHFSGSGNGGIASLLVPLIQRAMCTRCFSPGGRFPDWRTYLLLPLCAELLVSAASARAQSSSATISIAVDRPGATIATDLFGIFFEEISFAGEGGLYAEMVRNRAAGNSDNPDYWTLVRQGTAAGQISVDTGRPLNTNILKSLRLVFQSGAGSVGAANNGFWGMWLQEGARYDLSFYVCGSAGFSGPLNVHLESANGVTVYAQTSFQGLTTNWQRFTATLVSTGTDTNAQLVLSMLRSLRWASRRVEPDILSGG